MTAIANAIKKVATGPHLSKDLSIEEAKLAMLEILSGDADPVQAAVFFIGLRMKTETNDENLGILQALQDYTNQQTATISELLTLADPFNGYNRHCPVMAFLPAVLAASGLATVSQGVKEMGPKFGVTHSQVLAYAGMDTNQSVETAVKRIENPDIAWAYIDQAQSNPALYALEDLRTKMIKRPSLATLEKLLMPIKAQGKNHLLVGFVHKAYPSVLAWLANQAGFATAMVMRGIEGGILPTLRETSNNYRVHGDSFEEYALDPTEFDIEQTTRGVLPQTGDDVTAQETVEVGLATLSGQTGPAFDSLVLGAAMNLWHVGLQASPRQAADHVRQVITCGKAKAYFEAGMQ